MNEPLAAAAAGDGRVQPEGWAVGTLVAGLLITLAVCLWLREAARAKDALRLHQEAVLQKEALETRIELFVLMLRQLAVRAGQEAALTPEHWDQLVRDANVAGEFPGLVAVGFTQLRPQEPRGIAQPAWWAALGLTPPTNGMAKHNRATGATFHTVIHPLPKGGKTTVQPAGVQPTDEYWGRIIWAVEVAPAALPSQSRRDAWVDQNDPGFRVLAAASAPERHPHQLVMERHAAATATNKSLPSRGHYELDNEWGHTRGVVYGDFAMQQFVTSTLGTGPRAVAFRIWDAPADWQTNFQTSFNLVYGPTAAPKPYLEERLVMKHYGRRLLLDFYTTPEFDAHSLRRWPLYAGLTGGTITLLATGLVFLRSRTLARERADAERLRTTHERLKNALQDRERLNRDLHDTVIQSVYAAGLGLQSARRILGKDTERASERLTELMVDLNGVIARLRGYIHGAPPVAPGSLAAQLEETVAPFRRETTAALTLRTSEDAPQPGESGVVEHITNIVREAVSNAVRHAGATAISVRVEQGGDGLTIEIEDNGSGFDLTQAPAGCGLDNIRARALELQGLVQLHSSPGRGTLLRVQIPARRETRQAQPA